MKIWICSYFFWGSLNSKVTFFSKPKLYVTEKRNSEANAFGFVLCNFFFGNNFFHSKKRPAYNMIYLSFKKKFIIFQWMGRHVWNICLVCSNSLHDIQSLFSSLLLESIKPIIFFRDNNLTHFYVWFQEHYITIMKN